MSKLLSSSACLQDLIQWPAIEMPHLPQPALGFEWKGHLIAVCLAQGPVVRKWTLGLRFLLCCRGH